MSTLARLRKRHKTFQRFSFAAHVAQALEARELHDDADPLPGERTYQPPQRDYAAQWQELLEWLDQIEQPKGGAR
jgi:negative regulator of sigma E activity